MSNQAAANIISETFTRPFNEGRFALFIRNLLNDKIDESKSFDYYGNYIPDAFKAHVKRYKRLGTYTDPEGNKIDILTVQLARPQSLLRARTTQRNFIAWYLKKRDEKDAALVAYYSQELEDWRFSFIRMEYSQELDGSGRVKVREQLTPARRYSFLVGKNEPSHTAAKQLLPILANDYADPSIEEIEAAFSVEKVSSEFFEQYKQLFLKVAAHLKKQAFFQRSSEKETDRAVSRFAKKLLGQIVFLYFLQKKGWLGVPKDGKWGEGSKRFMRERFDLVMQSGGGYFHDFLEPLFYEALAKEHKGSIDPDYYPRFGCKIPFLNGGLFEAEYDWENETIVLPNELFHNDEKNKAGDCGTGIFDVFDRYNFTIKEDEPLEREVAIDPEMLGKVFENMLEVTERKSKGAFYTPREIVHYMCRESLIYYLENTLGDEVPREGLELLTRKGHLALENDQRVLNTGRETDTYKFQLPEPVRKHADKIDKALADIKICDPAIGSGAFPVGLLHEIVNARLALAPHSGNKMTAYELKRHAIRESIYGVDIDASAIDIARLRLWLSMIVDEERYNTIEPLPNLDYKIVQGDSLVGFPENWNSQASQSIEELKKRFFEETDQQRKAELKKEIDERIKARLAASKKNFGYQVNFDFRLFFSEVWHQKGGFDIVIGNPPYVQIQKFSGKQIQKDWQAQKYETFAKTGDIYCLFYEKGHRILRDGGVLAYITSNKWMRAAYGKKLREFFSRKASIYQLIDFGDSPIFSEATTYTNILIFEKGNRMDRQLRAWDFSSQFQPASSLEEMLEEHPPGAALLSPEGFIILDPDLAAIKKRIEQVGTPLKDWDVTINYGIKTGFNKAFIISGKKKDELIAADPKSAEIIKPILRGRDIKRYRVDFADLWLINSHNGHGRIPPVDINDYPAIKSHLDQYWDRLARRQDKGVTPYNLRNCAYLAEFEKEKIVWAEIVYDSAFYYDTSGVYPEATAFVLTGERTKYLTALLNSRLLTFGFRSFYAGGDLRGNTFRYKKSFMMNLPVIKCSGQKQSSLETLVDYIQFLNKQEKSLQSAFFEQLVDGLVYELYFPEELKVAGKEILPHIGELEPITDDMSEGEKLAVIQREFDRLYDPNHPVRNNLETLDSVDVVRIIRDALKK